MSMCRWNIADQRGLTYLTTLVAVVLIGIALSTVAKGWSVAMKREREAELLARGLEIKEAIERYAADFEVRKGTRENRYPLQLHQLVDGPKHYLRRLYRDPITGGDFDVIVENSEIRGVRSRSSERPLNQVQFQDAATYHDIQFKAVPPQAQPCANGISSINPLNPLAAPTCPPVPTPPGTSSPSTSSVPVMPAS
jgi:type II secretory pathway pseudopilin PulG